MYILVWVYVYIHGTPMFTLECHGIIFMLFVWRRRFDQSGLSVLASVVWRQECTGLTVSVWLTSALSQPDGGACLGRENPSISRQLKVFYLEGIDSVEYTHSFVGFPSWLCACLSENKEKFGIRPPLFSKLRSTLLTKYKTVNNIFSQVFQLLLMTSNLLIWSNVIL